MNLIQIEPNLETRYNRLKAGWSNCHACKLHQCRTQVVFGRGQLPADVLFIGEAPGASEDILGYAFVGRAGKILDEIIEATRKDRILEEVHYTYFITNTVGCRPSLNGKNEPPKEKMIDACKMRIVEIIMLAQPKLIVCLGKIAFGAWTKRLYRYQHKTFEIPAIHLPQPAYLLRIRQTEPGTKEFDSCVRRLTRAIENVVK